MILGPMLARPRIRLADGWPVSGLLLSTRHVQVFDERYRRLRGGEGTHGAAADHRGALRRDSPTGARIRTRLRPDEGEAAVLRLVGQNLGRLYRADLAARVRLGDVHGKHNGRAARKRALTAYSTSRWAGAITRTVEDQYSSRCGASALNEATLTRAVRTLDARIAVPVAGRIGRVKGYPTQAERAAKQRRRAVLAARLLTAQERLAAGAPSVVAGGRRLARQRHHLADAGLTQERWRQRWEAARIRHVAGTHW
jgi:hypothetical protein